MGRLGERLGSYSKVGLDTALFIYHFEKHPVSRCGIFFNNLLICAQRGLVVPLAEKIIRFFKGCLGPRTLIEVTASADEHWCQYDADKE